MKRMAIAASALLTATFVIGAGCSSDSGGGGSGGSGGSTGGSGGRGGSGGSTGGSGGSTGGSGGSTGGSTGGSGGTTGGSGGSTGGSGGTTGGSGGSTGGTGGTGGSGGSTGGTGGSTDGGPRDMRAGDGSGSEAGGGSNTMSFFVTSEGAGMGGNLGGLDGADAKCKALATAVSAQLGAKNWKAYLSTSTVDARTRIGNGPWHNAKGVMIASSLAQLHEEGGMMNAIRPSGMPSNAIDEKGNVVPMGGGSTGVHDILTGSTAMGTKDPMNRHCTNWTSTTGQAYVGHHDRMGGGSTSWNAVHAVGCGPLGGPMPVSSGGGRGSIYCFAAD